ncbi:MAG: alpha/beta hydrolase-fold protein [Acidobacteriota bacterium]|nr:alpha/beta hydrolase-fold protein [Acidobacteriota bacterium]
MSAFESTSTDLRKHERFASRFLAETRDLIVYLPPGYADTPAQRYPVLYLHDGQNLFDGATAFVAGQDWHVNATADAMIREGEIEPLIIVGIYNTGEHRIDDYTPTRDRKHRKGGDADLYGQMLTQEVKPFIDAEYRTLAAPGDTGLGGSSLGGLVTLYLGMRHPDVFGRLAVMSPSVWWDGRVILRVVRMTEPKPRLKIWLDIGMDEGKKTLLDARALRNELVRAGWVDGEDLAYSEVADAGHNEAAWASRVGLFLQYLFPRRGDGRKGRRRRDA